MDEEFKKKKENAPALLLEYSECHFEHITFHAHFATCISTIH